MVPIEWMINPKVAQVVRLICLNIFKPAFSISDNDGKQIWKQRQLGNLNRFGFCTQSGRVIDLILIPMVVLDQPKGVTIFAPDPDDLKSPLLEIQLELNPDQPTCFRIVVSQVKRYASSFDVTFTLGDIEQLFGELFKFKRADA
jgi:hypothetical protein